MERYSLLSTFKYFSDTSYLVVRSSTGDPIVFPATRQAEPRNFLNHHIAVMCNSRIRLHKNHLPYTVLATSRHWFHGFRRWDPDLGRIVFYPQFIYYRCQYRGMLTSQGATTHRIQSWHVVDSTYQAMVNELFHVPDHGPFVIGIRVSKEFPPRDGSIYNGQGLAVDGAVVDSHALTVVRCGEEVLEAKLLDHSTGSIVVTSCVLNNYLLCQNSDYDNEPLCRVDPSQVIHAVAFVV